MQIYVKDRSKIDRYVVEGISGLRYFVDNPAFVFFRNLEHILEHSEGGYSVDDKVKSALFNMGMEKRAVLLKEFFADIIDGLGVSSDEKDALKRSIHDKIDSTQESVLQAQYDRQHSEMREERRNAMAGLLHEAGQALYNDGDNYDRSRCPEIFYRFVATGFMGSWLLLNEHVPITREDIAAHSPIAFNDETHVNIGGVEMSASGIVANFLMSALVVHASRGVVNGEQEIIEGIRQIFESRSIDVGGFVNFAAAGFAMTFQAMDNEWDGDYIDLAQNAVSVLGAGVVGVSAARYSRYIVGNILDQCSRYLPNIVDSSIATVSNCVDVVGYLCRKACQTREDAAVVPFEEEMTEEIPNTRLRTKIKGPERDIESGGRY